MPELSGVHNKSFSNEILSMNKGVKPEIPPVLNSVRSTIEIFKKEEMNLERQIKFKEKRKLYLSPL